MVFSPIRSLRRSIQDRTSATGFLINSGTATLSDGFKSIFEIRSVCSRICFIFISFSRRSVRLLSLRSNSRRSLSYSLFRHFLSLSAALLKACSAFSRSLSVSATILVEYFPVLNPTSYMLSIIIFDSHSAASFLYPLYGLSFSDLMCSITSAIFLSCAEPFVSFSASKNSGNRIDISRYAVPMSMPLLWLSLSRPKLFLRILSYSSPRFARVSLSTLIGVVRKYSRSSFVSAYASVSCTVPLSIIFSAIDRTLPRNVSKSISPFIIACVSSASPSRSAANSFLL